MIWVFYAKWHWDILLWPLIIRFFQRIKPHWHKRNRRIFKKTLFGVHLKTVKHKKSQSYIGINQLYWLSSTVTVGDAFQRKKPNAYWIQKSPFFNRSRKLKSWSSWPLPWETLQLKSTADKPFPFTYFPFYTREPIWHENNFKLVTST